MATTKPTQPRETIKHLLQLLDGVPAADARRFRRRLFKARSPKALAAIEKEIQRSRVKLAAKIAALPQNITYPPFLPVSSRVDDIAQAIKDHQVVIIAGETGSGKTTQIPKICLAIGRGRTGLIGHTQPRRIAARTVAERIADEMGQKVGDSVGYAIRFDDRTGPHTAVKLMTDGILLAEMQRDRFLNAYDTIIIDEAHERSLNIDFLLGYFKKLLHVRKDLKIIITSATIETERFAQHFADEDGTPAPVIEVSGRSFPVDIRYRPLEEETPDGTLVAIDPVDGLIAAIEELMQIGPGDILCFFPSERDIRDCMEAIEGKKWRGVEVTPLFGRLSNAEQHRVFSPHSGRRIVLATNIAETSLTVPGIHYVVDTGTARISRYSVRTKVQRLPIEPVSQASANQRSGRCGRIADGVAIRLYSEADYLSRPEYTDPEILRTNLASVILQMASLRLGDITEFPFIQPPDNRSIRDGLLLLHELGALTQGEDDGAPQLTKIGRTLAKIPVDPRLARMLVEAEKRSVLPACTVIVAALSLQDVRERPLDFQAQADQAHARFKDPHSDFIALLNLWDYIQETREELSGNKFRTRMKKEFLHYVRIREWFDLVDQITRVAADTLAWDTQTPDVLAGELIDRDSIHKSLLVGMLSQIGMRISDSREYQGTRGTKYAIFPGSPLSKKPPSFIMAAELVETSRLWARHVASINPYWVEELAPDLIRTNYSEPFWSTKRVAAMAHMKATLYGVTIVADRTVPYHTVNPVEARDMFIRHALINGEWTTHHAFFHTNREKLDAASTFEDKARRRDIVVDEDTLFDFYDARIPATVTTGILFDQWWKKEAQRNKSLLDFDPLKLVGDNAAFVTEADFPDIWRQKSLDFTLTYHFMPGACDDGVTVNVPVPLLAGISEEGFDWLVPGLRLEMLTELIRTLPKPLRRTVVPAPEFAARALPLLVPYHGTVTEQFADALRKLGGTGINATDFRPEELPDHLHVSFAAIDKHGEIIDRDRNLKALKKRRAGQIKSSVTKAGRKAIKKTSTTWDESTLGTIEEEITTTVDGQEVAAFPALTATRDGFAVTVLPTKAEADASMVTATLTMLMRNITVNEQQMIKGLPLKERVAVDNYPHGGAQGLVNDARVAAIRDCMLAAGGPVRSPDDFEELKKTVAPKVPSHVRQTIVQLAPGLVDYHHVKEELSTWTGDAIDDMKQELEFLLPDHAISRHGVEHLRHLPRYLAAMRQRLDQMDLAPGKDADNQQVIEKAQSVLLEKLKTLPAGRDKQADVKEILWMIEELRVSLFAQKLGTQRPVSLRRIEKAVDKLR